MGSRRKLAITVLSLCGAAAGGTAFYAVRSRQIHAEPVTTPTGGDITLKNVQIFFRHGARTPLTNITGLDEVVFDKRYFMRTLPHTDIPHSVEYLYGGPQPGSGLQGRYNKVVFKGGMTGGVLTTVGQEQVYVLGRRLAARYHDNLKLIGNRFDDKEVYVQSTNMDRTIESLRCVIAGMFGVYTFSQSEPVIIRVNELKDEILFPSSRRCNIYSRLLTQMEMSYLFTSEFIDVVRQFQNHTGDTSALEDVNMMQLRDHIVAREAHGCPVPPFFEHLSEKIDRLAVDVLQLCVCGYIPDRLIADEDVCDKDCVSEARVVGLMFAVGRLLDSIKQTMQSAAKPDRSNLSSSRPKMYLYSCHDSTLTAILLSLGCCDDEWPPYAADVAFELYEDGAGKHWVKLRYCGKDMIVRGCEKPLVPLDQFVDVMKPYVVSQQQYVANCSSSPSASQLMKILSKKVPSSQESHVPEVL